MGRKRQYNWQGKVYHKSDATLLNICEWDVTREQILLRDDYICQRCGLRFPKGLLTAHHIIPRDQGGGNQRENLITLCEDCHDWVEERWVVLRTADLIKNSFEEDVKSKETIVYDPNDWHSYVYGYGKNQRLITENIDTKKKNVIRERRATYSLRAST